jgi:hypothetical protein
VAMSANAVAPPTMRTTIVIVRTVLSVPEETYLHKDVSAADARPADCPAIEPRASSHPHLPPSASSERTQMLDMWVIAHR